MVTKSHHKLYVKQFSLSAILITLRDSIGNSVDICWMLSSSCSNTYTGLEQRDSNSNKQRTKTNNTWKQFSQHFHDLK